MSTHTIQDEVDRNYEEFLRLLPQLIVTQRGKYALIKDGKVIGFFSSAEDARVAASSFISDRLFSIQQVTDTSINLGFYNYAVNGDPVHP